MTLIPLYNWASETLIELMNIYFPCVITSVDWFNISWEEFIDSTCMTVLLLIKNKKIEQATCLFAFLQIETWWICPESHFSRQRGYFFICEIFWNLYKLKTVAWKHTELFSALQWRICLSNYLLLIFIYNLTGWFKQDCESETFFTANVRITRYILHSA